MKAYLINPSKRSIEEFQYDGTISDLADHYPYRGAASTVCAFDGQGDAFLCLDPDLTNFAASIEGMKFVKEFGTFGFICDQCEEVHHLFGTAILASKDLSNEEDIVLKEPNIELADLRRRIKWGRAAEISPSELEEIIESGQLPPRLRNEEVPMDAKSEVCVVLEVSRIVSKVH